MEWIILFIASWVLFVFSADWKKLKGNIWGGLLAVALQLTIDTHAMGHDLYTVDKQIVGFLNSSVFFILGPVLVIGFLLAQYHPQKRWMIVLNVLVLTALYSAQELLLVARDAVLYHEWHFADSFGVNLLVIVGLSWFSLVVLKKTGGTKQ
jgi:hypothetical protein